MPLESEFQEKLEEKDAEQVYKEAEALEKLAQVAEEGALALDLAHSAYLEGCKFRDQAQSSVDLQLAIKAFERANSFAGFYAIAEIYQYGISRVYNGVSVRVLADAEQASKYYLKAYQANAAEQDEEKGEAKFLKVVVLNEKTELPDLSKAYDLPGINFVLDKAKGGNPQALYQLALFYEEELKLYNQGKSRISAFSSQLQQWKRACLEAAASLRHPHAAYKLLQGHATELSKDQKLKFSQIAADPNRYKEQGPGSLGEGALLTYRGSAPLVNPIVLDPPRGALPEELLEKAQTLSGGKMGGIFTNSVSKVASRKCLLPAAHQPATTTLNRTLSENNRDQTSAAAMREMRANRLLQLSRASSAEVTTAPKPTPSKAL